MSSLFQKVKIFTKVQISAFTGGVVSYMVTVFIREIFLFHLLHAHDISYYQSLVAVGIGETIGALINFTLNKTWAFKIKGNTYKHGASSQFGRFVLVVIQSIFFKATGVHFLATHFPVIDYKVWLLFVYAMVSLGNYALQRYWVFNYVPKNTNSQV